MSRAAFQISSFTIAISAVRLDEAPIERPGVRLLKPAHFVPKTEQLLGNGASEEKQGCQRNTRAAFRLVEIKRLLALQ